ncbi:unnamed protein product [Rotaria magnacalcarata]|uniref:Methyltransferase FkbM domain-containing protein n=1 Tax=Rotaria magnacalcarata TaxID=392030 RepID=A0A8S2JR41_9BILA|nr:unnamed protein product [Rotaria magnacalcarata]CAF3841821.1 unnamed protein product [Rotaria magnacalcarata]CAF3871142.1 unnamed protein product [Rotaria magnacalcarata]
MGFLRKCLAILFCFVVAILIAAACSASLLNIPHVGAIRLGVGKLNSSTKPNKQEIPAFFASRYARYLHPQIWACQSANFVGRRGYYSQGGEDEALHNWIFNDTKENQNPGIFVEIGAADGITFSNTLFFERMFDWRGVLIEAQPDNAKKLMKVNRKNTVKLPIGICSPPQTYISMLGGPGFVAGNIDTMDEAFRKSWHKNNNKTQQVTCGPIGYYLSTIGITHIDLFSLDIEGGEFSVLLTMDWNIQHTIRERQLPTT